MDAVELDGSSSTVPHTKTTGFRVSNINNLSEIKGFEGADAEPSQYKIENFLLSSVQLARATGEPDPRREKT